MKAPESNAETARLHGMLRDAVEIVLTAAAGYSANQIQPFVESLRATGCTALVVAYVHGMSALDKAELARKDVLTIEIQNAPGVLARPWHLRFLSPRWKLWRARLLERWAKHRPRTPAGLAVRCALVAPMHHVALGRYPLYLQLLKRFPVLDRIILADSRDVLFQSNPCAALADDELIISLEDTRGAIGSGEYLVDDRGDEQADRNDFPFRGINARWMADVYGPEVVRRLAAAPISCSGVTIGTRKAMLHYLAAMAGEVCAATGRHAGMMGLDQAMHNRLLWSGKYCSVTFADNTTGPVFTAHAVPDEELHFDAAGRLVNPAGRAYSIVHQYDRSPRLFDWAATAPWRKFGLLGRNRCGESPAILVSHNKT